jgi:gamma-glutamylcyclotransferase (GGCT)/AIG2-like uncharacterized protein YtfP
MSESPRAVFVYGTLKRGQVRERSWPIKPQAIEPATVRGTLYDLGKYPALIAGDDLVAGEIWRFEPAKMAETLAVLDRIEGFAGRDDDLYRRTIIECRIAAGCELAWVYSFARKDDLQSARRIAPNDQGLCAWPLHSPDQWSG